MNKLEVVHIVRRYGLVGGMEAYVWELTHALVTIGVKVEVICERLCGIPSPDIRIHVVTPDQSSSRWKAMLGFRESVNHLINREFSQRSTIIHSHERCLNHEITTFHGPPMHVKANWWRFAWLSNRIKAWKLMERDELLGSRVQLVLPVSYQIKNQLSSLYPALKNKNVIVTHPGVNADSHKKNLINRQKKAHTRLVFVGKEWKRKGLIFAIKVIEHYAACFGQCTMEIYGPAPSDLPRFTRQHPNLVLRGWSNDIQWSNYDALIHPATNEPFGMVIPEARSHGVPVVTTNVVGSVEMEYEGVIALDTCEDIKIWAASVFALINDKNARAQEVKWTWQQLALKHLQEIYPLVVKLPD